MRQECTGRNKVVRGTCSKSMVHGGWVVLIWQEGAMGSITSTILPHHRKAGGKKRCSKPAGRGEGQRSNPERIWGRGRGSQSSSLITLMCDSMSIGNSRHKISYHLFSLICSEKASILVLLPAYKDGILFCKCYQKYNMTKQLNIAAKLQWSGNPHFSFYRPEELLFHVIFQHCLGFFYFRIDLWLSYLGLVIWTM